MKFIQRLIRIAFTKRLPFLFPAGIAAWVLQREIESPSSAHAVQVRIAVLVGAVLIWVAYSVTDAYYRDE